MASDRRSYVRVPDSVLREAWSDWVLATLIRLMVFLNTRWARDRLSADEAGAAFLRPQELMLVAGTSHPTRARRRLLALAERSGADTLVTTEETVRGVRGVRVAWPEFVEFQGYRDREAPQPRGSSGATSPPPYPLPQTLPQPQEEDSALARGSPSRKSSRASEAGERGPRERTLPLHDEALPLAEHFAHRLLNGLVRFVKVPRDLTVWAGPIDKLLRLDGVEAAEVRQVIDWVTTHEFWAPNVLSTSKLRSKFPVLLAQMNRRPPPAQNNRDSVRGAVELLRKMR